MNNHPYILPPGNTIGGSNWFKLDGSRGFLHGTLRQLRPGFILMQISPTLHIVSSSQRLAKEIGASIN